MITTIDFIWFGVFFQNFVGKLALFGNIGKPNSMHIVLKLDLRNSLA
jgi:hypothetical protein